MPEETEGSLSMIGCAGESTAPFSHKPKNSLGEWNLGSARGANFYEGKTDKNSKLVGPTLLKNSLPATLVVSRKGMTLFTNDDLLGRGVKIPDLP